MHKLFCRKAKLCFKNQSCLARGEKEGRMLQFMRIPTIDRKAKRNGFETVLWDLGSTHNYVGIQHVEYMRFPKRKEHMSMVTLGGETKDMLGTIYDCRIRDLHGRLFHFTMQSLENIMGDIKNDIGVETIRKLFPNIKNPEAPVGISNIDYLIGQSNPSWHPVKTQRAVGGGDLWLWENGFGRYIAGSHP